MPSVDLKHSGTVSWVEKTILNQFRTVKRKKKKGTRLGVSAGFALPDTCLEEGARA
jgi:hypothetical protein